MTNNTQHTPEPWETNTAIHPNDQVFAGDTIVADCKWTQHEPLIREANAAHIVSCVNNCAGINPEAVPDMLETINAVIRILRHNCREDASPAITLLEVVAAKAEDRS